MSSRCVPGPPRWLPAVAVAAGLLVALLPGAAWAGGIEARTGLGGHGGVFSPRAGGRPRPTPTVSLAAFTARKHFEARVARLDLLRDAERRAAERWLRRRGAASELARYRSRIQREDAADDLRLRIEARRLFAPEERAQLERWWDSLGPVTRRTLRRSGLDLRRTLREAERDARLRDLQRALESWRPGAASRLAPGPPELP